MIQDATYLQELTVETKKYYTNLKSIEKTIYPILFPTYHRSFFQHLNTVRQGDFEQYENQIKILEILTSSKAGFSMISTSSKHPRIWERIQRVINESVEPRFSELEKKI